MEARDCERKAAQALERGDWDGAKDWIRAARDLTENPREQNAEAVKMGRLNHKTGAAAEYEDIKALRVIAESAGLDPYIVLGWRRHEAANIVRGADYQVDHPNFPLLVQRKCRSKVSVTKAWRELSGAWTSRTQYIRVLHLTWTASDAPEIDLVGLQVPQAIRIHQGNPDRELFLWELDECLGHYYLTNLSMRRIWPDVVDRSVRFDRPAEAGLVVQLPDIPPLAFYDWDVFLQDSETLTTTGHVLT